MRGAVKASEMMVCSEVYLLSFKPRWRMVGSMENNYGASISGEAVACVEHTTRKDLLHLLLEIIHFISSFLFFLSLLFFFVRVCVGERERIMWQKLEKRRKNKTDTQGKRWASVRWKLKSWSVVFQNYEIDTHKIKFVLEPVEWETSSSPIPNI